MSWQVTATATDDRKHQRGRQNWNYVACISGNSVEGPKTNPSFDYNELGKKITCMHLSNIKNALITSLLPWSYL